MMAEQKFLRRDLYIMATYNPDHEKALNSAMKGVKGATAEKMFGFPAYKVNGTLAVSVKSEGIVAKVGEKSAQKLIGKGGIKAYEPLPGRVWKEWVLITSDFDKHKAVFDEAAKYVAAESKPAAKAEKAPAKAAPAKKAAEKPAAKPAAKKPAAKKPAATTDKKPASKKK
jgi:hypothetical protein